MKKIAFIVQQPKRISPGQRFRFEAWEPILKDNGFEVHTYPFWDMKTVDVLYKKGYYSRKIIGFFKGFFKRFLFFIKIGNYGTIFLQREFAPLGPPIFEWIAIKLFKKRVIYDFDDAIWISDNVVENKWINRFKSFWKVAKICKWASVVTVGNHFLGAYAKQSGAKNIVYLPTVADEKKYIPKTVSHEKLFPVIGWTGSHSTLKYLDEFIPVLQDLEKKIDFTFLVIANKNPALPLKHFEFIKWNAETEIEDLQKIDIGVMPLTADKWSEGKCGFKLIQYMALAIPSVASPVGVNKEIITNEVNGFLCNTNQEWKEILLLLLRNATLRNEIGEKGLHTFRTRYSIQSQSEIFLQLFN
jgi:glycosyltransferase involved in cell wall biosynthesis